jgi:hypothetical protein
MSNSKVCKNTYKPNLTKIFLVRDKDSVLERYSTQYGSLDREMNPRPLAYGNTIEGTTTLTTKPNPLLQNRRFKFRPLNTLREIPW